MLQRLPREVVEIVEDPERFISRLEIANAENELQPLDPLKEEQLPWIRALLGPKKYILGLKPRQVGYTTIALAFLFAKLHASPHPKSAMSVVHDDDAKVRLRLMADTFMEGLPALLSPGWATNNDSRSVIAHNGASFNRRIAGGRGKSRGWTHNYLHATEMAHWPSATSASRKDEAGASDEEMFSSAMAAMPDPQAKVIVESTGNGPKGLFHELWQQAAGGDPRWAYVFVPWNHCRSYVQAVPNPAELEADLDDEEIALIKEHDLALEQIAWRRTKIRTERWSTLRFRREYPLSDMDPFVLVDLGWFDQERLARMLKWAPVANDVVEPLRIFHPYDPRRRYFMGVDTAGGTRKDEAVIHVIDDNLVHCATWASDRAGVVEQAIMVSRIGGLYHRPLCVIEANRFGTRVIARVEEFGGVELWKHPETGRDFWTTGGKAGDTKREACVHARTIVDHGWTTISDRRTIFQLQNIVDKHGKIEGAGTSHDDRAMAFIFALWAAREAHPGHMPAGLVTEIDRLREQWLPNFDPAEVAADRDRLREIRRSLHAPRR